MGSAGRTQTLGMSERLYLRLVEAAKARSLVTYREAAELVGLDAREPEQRAELSQLLRAISLHEHEQGRPLLSAVVVSQDTQIPGRGFFRLMRSLGLGDHEDDEVLFERELSRVHEHWSHVTSRS